MWRQELDIFLTAMIFFTRVKMPAFLRYTYHPDYLQKSSRYFPLVGWFVGGVAGLVYWAAGWVLPLPIAVLLSMLASILVTGAFHEDGFADMCDGFGGGWEKMQVLTIMKDSRLGTYGTVGLVGVLGLKFLSLVALGEAGVNVVVLLVATHALSRGVATTLIYTQNYVRENEDSKAKPLATKISETEIRIAGIFALLPLLLLPPSYWYSLFLVAGAYGWMRGWFVRRIGGYTGDCLGAMQQVTEVLFYVGVLIIAGNKLG